MVGFHSSFNRPDLKFFKDKESRLKTIEYLKKLSELCQELGGSQIVLGSPANRALSEDLTIMCATNLKILT